MTHSEIKARIVGALIAAELLQPDDKTITEYDDTSCLVSLYPRDQWMDGLHGECFIAIFADRVEKRDRRTPFNYTSSSLRHSTRYTTVDEMIAAIRRYSIAPKAECWA